MGIRFDIGKFLLLIAGSGGVSGLVISSTLHSDSKRKEETLNNSSQDNATIKRVEEPVILESKFKKLIYKTEEDKLKEKTREESTVKSICKGGKYEETLGSDGKSVGYTCPFGTIFSQ